MSGAPLSQLEQTLQSFRAALLRRDAATLAIVDRRWRVVQRMLLDDLDDLLALIAAAESPKVSWLRRQRRYQDLLSQIEVLTNSYALDLAPTITAGQETAVTMAAEHAVGLVRAQLVDRVVWNTLPVSQVNEMIGRLSDGSPLKDYLATFGKVAASAAEEALINGVARGQGVRVISADLAKIFGVRGAVDPGLIGRKAMLTSRSAVLGSYRSASLASYRANTDVLAGWTWIASIGPRCCPVCVAKHGSKHPVTEEFASHPACRCSCAPLSKGWSEIFGRPVDIPETRLEIEPGDRVFAGLAPDVQLAILGKSKLRMWNAGQLTFGQLVAETNHSKWGKGLRERSLREIQGAR